MKYVYYYYTHLQMIKLKLREAVCPVCVSCVVK